jgi:hypothetical protein
VLQSTTTIPAADPGGDPVQSASSAAVAGQRPSAPASTCGPTRETTPRVVVSPGSSSHAPVPLDTSAPDSHAPQAGHLSLSHDAPSTSFGLLVPAPHHAATTVAAQHSGVDSGLYSAAAVPGASSLVPMGSSDVSQIAPRTRLQAGIR